MGGWTRTNGFGFEGTCITQGCFGGPQNDAIFEGSGFLGQAVFADFLFEPPRCQSSGKF